jgi:predicted TIM-barrel fold metal-dependent hydrolase
MDDVKFSGLSRASRRDFLAGLAALGATTLLPGGSAAQQRGGQGGGGRGGAPAAPPIEIQGPKTRIDVHQHFVSPDYLAVLQSKPAGTIAAQVAGTFTPARYSPTIQLENMDRAGIATAMISPTAPAAWFGNVEEAKKVAREMNEYATAKMVQAYKNRFGLFAVLPMPDVDGCLKEIAYAYDTLKVDGISFLTSYDGKYLGDKIFDPVFDELNRRNAIVYTHPLEPSCCKNPLTSGVSAQTLEYPTDTTRIIMNLVRSGTAARCPNIKFIFSHAGGTIVSVAQRFLGNEVSAEALKGAPGPNLTQVRRFFYDTAGSASPIPLQSLKLLIPTSQIVFGTDYPFGGQPAATVQGVQAAGFNEAELKGINRDNALKILPRLA